MNSAYCVATLTVMEVFTLYVYCYKEGVCPTTEFHKSYSVQPTLLSVQGVPHIPKMG